MIVLRFNQQHTDLWNDFVATSKNATFLFDRRYMDYHADRFEDHSLMFFNSENKLRAIIPANISNKTWISHQGLTYGGLLMSERTTAEEVQEIFLAMNDYLRDNGIEKVVYKPVPHIYHRIPAEEDLYSLFNICKAHLSNRLISSAIDLQQPLKWNRDRRYGINKAKAGGVVVEESNSWEEFWNVLIFNLEHKYGATPVHSLKEILMLHERFPDNIKLFTASVNDRIVGGTIIYKMHSVAHTQYISANTEGKKLRVLDALFDHILHKTDWGVRYFDFGTSNEDGGNTLVCPLIYQKEGFGGRGICYDCYEYTI